VDSDPSLNCVKLSLESKKFFSSAEPNQFDTGPRTTPTPAYECTLENKIQKYEYIIFFAATAPTKTLWAPCGSYPWSENTAEETLYTHVLERYSSENLR
jgi:hypothetical protein